MEIKNSQLIQRPKGHYYNAAEYAACPICNGNGATVPVSGIRGGGDFPPTEAPTAAGFGGMSPGATIPVDNAQISTPDPFGRTIIGDELSPDGQMDPVVGWLVCIDGPVRGVDFRTHAGYNYIGRETGDIHIHGDMQISKENHAMIAYDASDHTFYVGPASGRNLIKVNAKTVITPIELQSYDVLSIGTTKLLFVALCGERFGWNEGVQNG